jgi:hypothetical protein
MLSPPFLLPLILLNLLATIDKYGTILNQYISMTVTFWCQRKKETQLTTGVAKNFNENYGDYGQGNLDGIHTAHFASNPENHRTGTSD